MSEPHPLRSFQYIRVVAALFEGFPRPWFVAGGWAVDLFLGTLTRQHEDVDLAVFAQDQEILQTYLAGWELSKVKVGSGVKAWTKWEDREQLQPPHSLIRAQRASGDPLEFEVILPDTTDGQWRFHRDPTITHPLENIGAHSSIGGIPYLAPEIMLLWKAKYHRPKDEHDFHQALPRLDSAQRAWLRGALQAHSPADPWLDSLT